MTKVDSAIASIRVMVINKEYSEDGYLPSEGELSERLGVSKATIREAVRALEVRGMVTRVHGRGIMVEDKGIKNLVQSMSDMLDMQDIGIEQVLEARWIIETQAGELAVRRITEEQLAKMETLVLEMEKRDSMDAEYMYFDLRFHQILVAACGNEILKAVSLGYSTLLFRVIAKSNATDGDLECVYHFHRNIYEALRDRDRVKAKRAIREQLSRTAINLGVDMAFFE